MIWSCDICDHYLYTYDKSQLIYTPKLKRYTYDDHPGILPKASSPSVEDDDSESDSPEDPPKNDLKM